MTRQLAPERPAAFEFTDVAPSPTGLVAAAAAVRGAAVAVSGATLAAGLALVLWAVTPASGADPGPALQGGVVAFASANLMPVLIGDVWFTLPPLMLTLLIAGLLAATARRGRFLPRGRYQEAVAVAVTAAVYGLVVAAITRGLGPPEAVPASWVWTAAALALVATSAGMLGRGSAWRDWMVSAADRRFRLGVRGAGIGIATLIAGGGLAVAVGLIAHFGSAVAVAAIAAPSWSDGLGMAMLGLAFLPNAVIAGTGFVTGVGFEIGPGTYSPLATATVELPAVPLLAAAPDQSGRSLIGLAFLAFPVVAGYLIARAVSRHLHTRLDRMIAAGLAGVLTGVLLGAAAAIARGGIDGGRWSAIGSPPLLVGVLAASEVGLVAVGVAAVFGGRSVRWRQITDDGPVAPAAAEDVTDDGTAAAPVAEGGCPPSNDVIDGEDAPAGHDRGSDGGGRQELDSPDAPDVDESVDADELSDAEEFSKADADEPSDADATDDSAADRSNGRPQDGNPREDDTDVAGKDSGQGSVGGASIPEQRRSHEDLPSRELPTAGRDFSRD